MAENGSESQQFNLIQSREEASWADGQTSMDWRTVVKWKNEVADVLEERGERDLAISVRYMNRYTAYGFMAGWPIAALAAARFIELTPRVYGRYEKQKAKLHEGTFGDEGWALDAERKFGAGDGSGEDGPE